MIRIVLVDDHHVVRRGMRSYLETVKDFQVVGEAASGEALLEALAADGRNPWSPDVVMMDLLLPGGMDGIEATRQVRAAYPGIQVVVLTAYTDDARVIGALRAGAVGFVRKDAQPEFLVSVIRAAAEGRRMIDPNASAALVDEVAQLSQAIRKPARPDDLSPREMDVLRRLARGLTNRQIAAELVVGEETVKSHVASILSKLGLENRAQVAAYALRQGWIKVDEM